MNCSLVYVPQCNHDMDFKSELVSYPKLPILHVVETFSVPKGGMVPITPTKSFCLCFVFHILWSNTVLLGMQGWLRLSKAVMKLIIVAPLLAPKVLCEKIKHCTFPPI